MERGVDRVLASDPTMAVRYLSRESIDGLYFQYSSHYIPLATAEVVIVILRRAPTVGSTSTP